MLVEFTDARSICIITSSNCYFRSPDERTVPDHDSYATDFGPSAERECVWDDVICCCAR